MTISEITRLRQYNQQLSTSNFTKPVELVSWLCAVQSQDYGAAKWALGLRLPGSIDQDIEDAFNRGDIIRTHVMRPTWHFVAPEDIRWMQQLTAPRVKTILASSGKKLGLDEASYKKSNKIIAKALAGGRHLTRGELETIINKAGIATDDLHMIHIMMRAELDSIICSGPRHGKQFTYALMDEWVPDVKPLTRDEALATLMRLYMVSHGPATLQDFVWWSGLTVADARKGIDMVKSNLMFEEMNGKEYWFSPDMQSPGKKQPDAYLLPNFDEYTVSYKDRHLLVDDTKVKDIPGPFAMLSNTIVVDGRVAGTWKRAIKKDKIEIATTYFHELPKTKKLAVGKAAQHYGKFYGQPVTINA